MTHAPDDYALVIGINDYPQWNRGAKSLKGPVKDAQDFRDWLVDEDGGGLPCKNVKLVCSTKNPLGPRQHVVDDAFREIREQSEGKARRRFYFYFSGHGHSRAGSWQQQSLCLANWSPIDAGAALHLESYIKASVGCLKFSEGVFFLDCCRVRAVVPIGQQSELECGDPQTTNRYSAVLFGSDQYEPTYEGEVDQEVRGYFTTGLLKVLKEGTIELVDLLERLRVIVPDLAKPKEQTVRAVPADKKIYLGPPDRKPPQDNDAASGTAPVTPVAIDIETNLTGTNTREHPPFLRTGDISVFRDDVLAERDVGFIRTSLVPGRYQVRIDHAEASQTHDIDVTREPFERRFELPRRRSATLLSSTVDKREWLTDPVVEASRWDASGGGQAAFVSLRPRALDDAFGIAGTLVLEECGDSRVIGVANSLYFIEPGTWKLRYVDPDGGIATLPLPITKDWDTHIFILLDNGRPQLATASVSMRPAGAGFDPSDALIDAYERGVADLVTGGPGPDPETLDDMLWGKYRNPLFGLLGAHFLIRKLRQDARPKGEDLERLTLVTRNLGELLSTDAPDIVALRLWKALIAKEGPAERLPDEPPLFNVGFQAFVEATARQEGVPDTRFDQIALGLDGNSPWTLWRYDTTGKGSWASQYYPTRTSTFGAEGVSIGRLRAIEKVWREAGFAVERGPDDEWLSLRAPQECEDWFDAFYRTGTMLSVPDWVVDYMRDALHQSRRRDDPLELDFARLVRRTMLPLSVLLAAKTLAEHGHDERDGEATTGVRGVAAAQDVDAAEAASPAWLRHNILEKEAEEDKSEEDEADGETPAGRHVEL